MSDRFKCLDGAREAVTARKASYGTPEENFTNSARLWSVILGVEVRPYQVALCLDAVKTARLIADPTHADSWIDKAGYAACGFEVRPASNSKEPEKSRVENRVETKGDAYDKLVRAAR